MKRIILTALLFLTLMLCACSSNTSRLTESQTEKTTTKQTSLTIASQATTPTTPATTAATTQKTEFTSKDSNHTELEGKNEILGFCKYITEKWAALYSGGADFDFTPYCRYSELARYLDFTAKHSEKSSTLGNEPSVNISELSYWEATDAVKIKTLSSIGGEIQYIYFIVQTVDGKLMLSDMMFESMDAIDLSIRAEQMHLLDAKYWAKQGRYDELVKAFEKDQTRFDVSDKNTLTDADEEKIGEFSRYIADSWANYCCVDMNDSFFRYFKYDDMIVYFKQTSSYYAVDGGQYFYPDQADLKIESIKLSGAYATVTGTYPNHLRQHVKFVFIVQNVGGKLKLNDLICAQKELPDQQFRPQIVNDPKPDYWAQKGNLEQIEKKIPGMAG
ncbi:MAG: hypothetical protein IJM32_01530 [Ruminococcus sp.]|nr:hypothetical protein [Ruminococcus sp.]